MKKFFYKMIYGKKIKIGKRVTWRRGFSIMKMPDAVINIGDDCFFNNDCSLAANISVSIGERSIMGENVKIYDHNHRFNENMMLKQQGYSGQNIVELKKMKEELLLAKKYIFLEYFIIEKGYMWDTILDDKIF